MLRSVVKACRLSPSCGPQRPGSKTPDDQAALKADIKGAIAQASDQFVQAAMRWPSTPGFQAAGSR